MKTTHVASSCAAIGSDFKQPMQGHRQTHLCFERGWGGGWGGGAVHHDEDLKTRPTQRTEASAHVQTRWLCMFAGVHWLPEHVC